MKTLVLTATSREYVVLNNLTSPKKQAYAHHHGYHCSTWLHLCESSEIAWDRVWMWRSQIEKCDWLFFTGADVGFTFEGDGPSLESILPLAGADLFFTLSHFGDHGHEVDGMVMRNCAAVRNMLDALPGYRGKTDCNNESDALAMYICGHNRYGDLRQRLDGGESPVKVYNGSPVGVSIVHPRLLMAVPRNQYSVLHNGRNDPATGWVPGAFAAHLIRKSLAERVAWFSRNLQ